jgi:predicted nucleic acid-binding protein
VKRIVEHATYWDTSAILSALFADAHSDRAASYARSEGFHFVTSLGWAEAHVVMSRIEREGVLSRTLVDAARATLEAGPWRRINAGPSWKAVVSLARRWPLRGADLWHLATAKELQADIPELAFLSFDQRLNAAAEGEGLIHESRS